MLDEHEEQEEEEAQADEDLEEGSKISPFTTAPDARAIPLDVEFVEDEEDLEEADNDDEDEAVFARLKEKLQRRCRELEEDEDIESMLEENALEQEESSARQHEVPSSSRNKKRSTVSHRADTRPRKRRGGPRIEVEYEDDVPLMQETMA